MNGARGGYSRRSTHASREGLRGAFAVVLAATLLVAARADATVIRWEQIAGGPTARDFAAAAYGNGRIVVFGGRTGTTALADTWIWNGTTWRQITAGGPSARFGAAIAYNPNTDLFVLTGGTIAAAPVAAGTFHFNPVTETWTGPLDLGGPQRAFHALAFDPLAQQVVLFGGTTGGSFPTETLSWDGTTWSTVTTTGGGGLGRTRHGLAYDTSQGGLVLYGGNVGGFILDDAWILKAGAWTPLSGAWAGIGRQGHGLAYDPNQSKVTIYAGRITNGVIDDMRLSNAGTTQEVFPVPAASPSPRSGVVLVYDESRRRGMVIGGSDDAAMPQPDANWEFFMTGQPCASGGQCATNVCATGVCCLGPCDPPCRDCDRVNTQLDPNAIDGVCRPVTGQDPRFCVFDQGCRGSCSEIQTCVYPGRTKACGLCLACNDQSGKCDQMPMSEDDPNCKPPAGMPVPMCSDANLSCRTYSPPSPQRRCLAPGKCGWRWSDCTNFTGTVFPCP